MLDFVLDAVLIHGDHWLILESKYKAFNSDIKRLDEIGRFLREHGDEPWVKCALERPTEIVLVMNSFGVYPEQIIENSTVHLVARDGVSYKELT